MKKACLLVAILAMLAVYAAPAVASTAITNVPNGYGQINPNDSASASMSTGWSFTPTQNLTVTALGYANPNGLPSNADVGIYEGATLVASATVTGSDTADGYWTFHAVSVALTAGHTYSLVASNVGGTFPYWDPAKGVDFVNRYLALGSEIGYISGSNRAVNYGSGGLAPIDGSAGGFVWGNASTGNPVAAIGNFQYEVASTPEPATMGLLGLGLVGLIARRKK